MPEHVDELSRVVRNFFFNPSNVLDDSGVDMACEIPRPRDLRLYNSEEYG